MNPYSTVGIFSAVVFSIVEALFDPIKKKWPKFYENWNFLGYPIAFLLAGGLSIWARLNIVPAFAPEVTDPTVGMVFTAAVCGGGAKVISVILDRVKGLVKTA